MKIFDLLKVLVSSVTPVFLAIVGFISIVIGAISDPAGAVNSFICRMIDLISIVWPSTPESLKLSNIIFPQLGGLSIGRAFLVEFFNTAFLMLGILLVVKLYKLIPFKAT